MRAAEDLIVLSVLVLLKALRKQWKSAIVKFVFDRHSNLRGIGSSGA
jgi:hypothetical protein